MSGAACAIVIAAACGGRDLPTGGSFGEPVDGGPDGQGEARDSGIDAEPDDATGPDAGMETTDLTKICGGTAPVTFDDWENCYLQRKCEWQVGCVALNSYRDVQDCVASANAVEGGRLGAERRERKRAVDQGRASINVDAFAQCLIRTDATHCNTALFDVACLTRFTGTTPDGDSCYTNVDCASPDAVCKSDCADACCLGICQPKFREGQTCTAFGSCEPGLQCDITYTCITGDINTPCAEVLDCDFNAWCAQRAHRCKPRFPPGAACTDILQCRGDTTCIGLSITDLTPGHCLRNSKPGDPCDGSCHGNLYCDGTGTCRDLPALGEACSSLIPCAGADAICNNGVCALRSDVGVSCGNQTCLPQLFCTSALADPKPACTPRGAVGAPCAAPGHCESYLCSGTPGQPGVCLPWIDTCP